MLRELAKIDTNLLDGVGLGDISQLFYRGREQYEIVTVRPSEKDEKALYQKKSK